MLPVRANVTVIQIQDDGSKVDGYSLIIDIHQLFTSSPNTQ